MATRRTSTGAHPGRHSRSSIGSRDLTLAIDTATTACSVALFDGERLIAHAYELVGRGHAERLIPMIAELPDGGRAHHILVDVGPGSFTGVRVGVAAARALALAWRAEATGYSSLASLAATAFCRSPVRALVAVLEGGHGEVFMQGFTAPPLLAVDALASRLPSEALAAIGERMAVGEGTRRLAPLAPDRTFIETLPDAADVLLLPPALRTLPPRPVYGRAPDAKLPAR